MRRRMLLAAGCLLLLLAGWYYLRLSSGVSGPENSRATNFGLIGSGDSSSPIRSDDAKEASPLRVDPARTIVLERNAEGLVPWPTANETVRELNRPETTAAADIDVVQSVLSDYRRVYGENPEGGLNEELIAGLRGDNPKRIEFLPARAGLYGSAGELLDRWGTPYFFHKLSAKIMELRSAGPDRVMWTPDDVADNAGTGGPPL